MLQRSLTLLALAGLLSPVSAQEAHEFSYDRPDAMYFGAVLGDRLLPEGTLSIAYTFEQADYDGIRFGTDEISAFDVFQVFGYTLAPFDRQDRGHILQLAYGVTDRITVRGSARFLDYERDLINEDLELARTENDGIGDVEVEGLLQAYASDAFRAHASLGLEIPVGSFDGNGLNVLAGAGESRLPYSMQTGNGSFTVVPGLTLATQNEVGTVGFQAKARFRLGANDSGWQEGDELEAKMWAGYRFGDILAVNSGIRVLRYGSIEGFDPALDPLFDPANDVILSGGTVVSVPLGATIAVDSGLLENYQFQAEIDWPIHQDYDLVRLSAQRAFRVTVSRAFGL